MSMPPTCTIEMMSIVSLVSLFMMDTDVSSTLQSCSYYTGMCTQRSKSLTSLID